MDRPSHHRHSISSHFVFSLLRGAEQSNLDSGLILQQAGLHPDFLENSQVRVTPYQLSKLIAAIWHQGGDEFMGLSDPPSRIGLFGLLAELVIHSPNLAQVYRTGERFLDLTDSALKLALIEPSAIHDRSGAERCRLELALQTPARDPDHSLIEFLLMIWHRFPAWLIGRPIPLLQVGFIHQEPQHAHEYQLMYGCPVAYQQRANFIEFDRALLETPVQQTADNLQEYLQRAPLDWLRQQVYFPNYTRRVLDLLQRHRQLSSMGMEQVAQQLHLTSRTLRRKLTEEGTSFRSLKDAVSRDQSIHLLSQRHLSVAQVARKLGFSEPAAFTRAFKSWTGVTPNHYRRQLQKPTLKGSTE